MNDLFNVNSNLFLAINYNSLTQELSSIAIMSEEKDLLYIEINDTNSTQLLNDNKIGVPIFSHKSTSTFKRIDKDNIIPYIQNWLSKYRHANIWVNKINYINICIFLKLINPIIPYPIYDLSTFVKLRGLNPDMNLETFLHIPKKYKHLKYTSLYDVYLMRKLFNKLKSL